MNVSDFISHIVALCVEYAKAELAHETAKSGEERETYGIRALVLFEHLEDDLVFFGQMSARAVIQTVSAN